MINVFGSHRVEHCVAAGVCAATRVNLREASSFHTRLSIGGVFKTDRYFLFK